MSHEVRTVVAKILGLDEALVRVVVPDVGGGFGSKFLTYPEEVVLACATRLLNRPLKWVEDRREHFLSAIQARTQFWDLELATDASGKILAVRGRMTHDQGAYTPQGFNLPYNASVAVPGPYIVPAYSLVVDVVETNRPPTIPVRGAGYPEATFAMERLLDVAASEIGLGRAEIRRLNLIPAEQIPYEVPLKIRSGSPVKYDSGDFKACQAMALEMIGYDQFRPRQEAAKEQGRYLGIGVANGIKGTGRGPFESAVVSVGRSGNVTVYTGAHAMGQGLKTIFTQIVADALGLRPDNIRVVAGDTSTISLGQGGFASRQTVVAGSAVHLAAVKIRKKALHVAAHLLEVPETDLSITDGKVHVSGIPSSGVTLSALAEALAGVPGYALPADVEPGLVAQAYFSPSGLAYGNATHAVEVEVSADTGATTICRYVVVNDCGRMINPTLVEGQIHGGVVHGIGNALFEQMIFDEDAQPLTTNFGDYLLPTSTEVPFIEIAHMESPSPLNPLGVKGVGELGVVPAAAAIVSAIENALSPWNVRIDEYPVTPMLVVDLITSAEIERESIE
jgi:carbon-monoxide dehydrogenase large subunit